MKKIKLIAETAWHHDGDYTFFKELISKLDNSSCDIIKMHITLDLDEYMSETHNSYEFAKSRMFTENQWAGLIKEIKNKEILLLINDTKAADFAKELKINKLEIHSVCLNDFNLLDKLKQNFKANVKFFIGVGGSTIQEIEQAISVLETKNIVMMHGFQSYPTKYEDINLNKMRHLIVKFPEYEHGYADHTAWDSDKNELITLFGAAAGVDYIEKHVTLTPGEKRTDYEAAISFHQLNNLIENLEILSKANGDGNLELNEAEKKYSITGQMKKAPLLKVDVKEDTLLTKDMIYFKRTNENTDISQFEILSYIGKNFGSSLKKDTVIKKDNFKGS